MSSTEQHPLWRYAEALEPLEHVHREPLPSPGANAGRSSVQLFHPKILRPFLEFDALDYDQRSKRCGVMQRLCLDACCALAGNRPGYFCTDENGKDHIAEEEMLLVGPGKYWYMVHTDGKKSDTMWLFVPNFESWSFPLTAFFPSISGSMKHWDIALDSLVGPRVASQSQMSALVLERDGGRCVVSGYRGRSMFAPIFGYKC